ncbi:TVP38/TMEM64 family protein [Anaerocolumna xylanovorans]|uniref:TVP38/TMEM64 family membrane protein n=1 Tax=Anaerocolumna xylanovorans DSM 12503 TaxID=1121345 RepID=A0A1M7YC75_9FIRM|nr:TVP38/TMEM64 family protein [Anaerocolumna xylanovorans]SHO50225.1 Uncharacterized membrane protein YdjX, TVP38/TMEM64 family, SNARE-associated domain [Anaerocolumna xylanovorans DSM 12503]
MKRKISFLDFITVLGFVLVIAFLFYGYKAKIFVSSDALHSFLSRFGIFADIIFILVQAVQVVIPIVPGSIGCLAGVLIFGPVKGFLYNYIGICMGSIIAFLLARRYGTIFVEKISKPGLWKKYSSWLSSDKFDKWFALAIFFPVAPDDFLCYLAGITKISLKKFSIIILAGKPVSIAAYSMGLNLVFTALIHSVGY